VHISVNLPYVDGGSTLTRRDEYVLSALLVPVYKIGNLYLRNRPKVAPYDLGSIAGRIVTFNIKNAFEKGSPSLSNAVVLRALLDGLIAANVVYLKYHTFPSLYESGVVYKRTNVWDSLPALYHRGYGDCKSLTAALVAERMTRRESAMPVFRWMPRPNEEGVKDFHILVESSYGYEDPSRRLGMGADENAYFAKG